MGDSIDENETSVKETPTNPHPQTHTSISTSFQPEGNEKIYYCKIRKLFF